MKAFSLFISAAFFFSLCSAQTVKVNECVIANGKIQQVAADYDQATGEKYIVVNGTRKKFHAVYPSMGNGYAAGVSWFINNETIIFNKLPYAKYGLPRVLGYTDVIKKSDYKAVGIYLENGLTGFPEVIYIPVRQGCEFQPYQLDCSQLFKITGPDTIQAGKTATLKFISAKGQPARTKFNWSVSEGTIVSGQGTTSVVIAAREVRDDKITITLETNTELPCRNTFFEVYIKH